MEDSRTSQNGVYKFFLRMAASVISSILINKKPLQHKITMKFCLTLRQVWNRTYFSEKYFFNTQAFFYKQHFYTQRQPNAKQQPKAELLTFENYSHSPSALSSKNNRTHSKIAAKEQVYLYAWGYKINHTENEKIYKSRQGYRDSK